MLCVNNTHLCFQVNLPVNYCSLPYLIDCLFYFMKFSLTIILCLLVMCVQGQLLVWTPGFIEESDGTVVITVDAVWGNQGLKDYASTSDVYVHTGVITSLSTNASDWKHAKFTWGTTPAAAQCTYLGNNKWSYTISGGLRTFYNLSDPSEKILKIAILFRNGTGNNVQRNADGSDMFVPVYETGLHVRLTSPFIQPKYDPVPEPIIKSVGESIAITAKSSQNAELRLFFNGTQAGNTVANGTTISASALITTPGSQQVIAQAVSGSTQRDTINFFVTPVTVTAPLPEGAIDGINYHSDATTATLVLFAPGKNNVRVIGDFNNWTEQANYQMNRTPDGSRYWLTVSGLTPGEEYGYQYLVDNTLKVADIYSEKILDPWNDQYIPAITYPGLKPYPAGKTTGIVSVLQTNKPVYNWKFKNFTRPHKGNLVIYELLIRDFVATQRWKTVQDSIPYLKKLGITAIELMPVNEFEGNNSWGYNPDFYFAPDKNYGTENDFKSFIDECHKNGIAVIMDIALNHAFGLSPTVQLYFNATTNKPASDNPWHNEDATHPFNVGYDFNHESQATKDLVDRVVTHWLVNYHIDGFRWDLSKGFTQTYSGSNVQAWSNYDAGRINTWKRIYNKMQADAPGSYCILEHFADNEEEKELANYGMLLWGNGNYHFNEATMGWIGSSNLSSTIYTNRGWSNPNLVGYMESHDEERLMYRNYQYGNSSTGPPPYSTKSIVTALKRMGMAASFWAMTPAPKMMWQFGELGYDSTINACHNGTPPSEDCRTSPKPIKWDYLNNTNRKALYDVYARLLTLRKVPAYLPAFTTTHISYSLGGAFKWLQVNEDSLKICVIGNFDVTSQTSSVSFPSAGTWYPYIKGGSKYDITPTHTATGTPQSFTLNAGEYYVFLDRDPSPVLPVTYTFIGNGNWDVNSNWSGNLMPPGTLPPGSEIIIAPAPGGTCILNVPLTIATGGKIMVQEGKNFVVGGNLTNN